MTEDILNLVQVGPVSVDDYSTLRHLHASSIRSYASEKLTIDEVDALLDYIYSGEYIDKVHGSDPVGAWIEGELAATCGWSVADDTGMSARITQLYVSPLFGGCGLGRLMLNIAQDRANSAGFMQIGVRAIASGASFLQHMGYEITSHGVQPLPSGVSIPVVFLRKMQSVGSFMDRFKSRIPAAARPMPLIAQ